MSIRTERLGTVIQRDLGAIIQKHYQHGTIITVTRVDVTEDLMIAKIYLSIMAPGQDTDTVFDYLQEHVVDIRKRLANKIRHQVRRIPELHLVKDESAAYAQKMERIFDEIREEREQRQDGIDDEEE
ncbi:MAG: 30S ribosome-binding factor RbfA [Bacteroidota bacterium]